MKKREPIIMSWSGGKDSCLALHAMREAGDVEVTALITTITDGFDRVSMHGVRRELLREQCDCIGIPLHEVRLSTASSYEEYSARTTEAFTSYLPGISRVAFGDLFLEDLKLWRDKQLAAIGMTAHYPLWKMDTTLLAKQFIEDGFKAVLVCVDGKKLDANFAGREYDLQLLCDLPGDVDPCGENGEFHTLVYDGPIFKRPLGICSGERVTRDQFHYCDFCGPGAEKSAGISEFNPPVMK